MLSDTVWPEILAGNLIWRIGGFESNPLIFHLPNNSQCDVIIIAKSWLSCVARTAAKRASLIVGMELKAASEDITSPTKEFCTPDGWKKSWLVCQREEGDPNDRYAVAVKTNATKTVEIKCNNDLSSFQLQFIITFLVINLKLAHGPVEFPAPLI